MSDAIDNAEVMLYAVSEAYKESGNCRLEANYAHQQDVDMIPLVRLMPGTSRPSSVHLVTAVSTICGMLAHTLSANR